MNDYNFGLLMNVSPLIFANPPTFNPIINLENREDHRSTLYKDSHCDQDLTSMF
jgi:hypothetical protein